MVKRSFGLIMVFTSLIAFEAYCVPPDSTPIGEQTAAPSPTPTPPYGDCKLDEKTNMCSSQSQGCGEVNGQPVKCCLVRMYCGEFGQWTMTDKSCMCFNKKSLDYFCKNSKKIPRVKCRYTTECGGPGSESDKAMCPKPDPEPIPGGGLTY